MRTKREQSKPKTQDSTARSPSGAAQSSLDELDSSILSYLERNRRATNYEVGEEVGLSASAASRRIQALEAMGAIRGYRTLIDDRLLGKQMTVFVRVTLERQSASVLSAFEHAVRRTRGIVSCHLIDRKSTRLNSSHLGISYAV